MRRDSVPRQKYYESFGSSLPATILVLQELQFFAACDDLVLQELQFFATCDDFWYYKSFSSSLPATISGGAGNSACRRLSGGVLESPILARSRHQLEPPIRQQIISPPSPQNRIPEKSANPNQKTGDILQRHEPPKTPREWIAQGVVCRRPSRGGAKYQSHRKCRPPSRPHRHEQQSQRQRVREDLTDVAPRT